MKQTTLRNLCYSQLPDGENILHYLSFNPDSLSYLYEKVTNSENDDVKFYIPLLYDINNKTAIDYLISPLR